MKIEDGAGSGKQAKVDSEHRLCTFSITEPEDKHINREGKVWSFSQDTTTVAVSDFVFYFKNLGEFDLAITDLRFIVGTPTTMTIETVTGSAGGATAVLAPVTRNLGASLIPDATALESADITGLTGDGVLYFQRCAVADTHYHLTMSSNIIIPQGQSVAIRSSVAAAVETLVSVIGLES
jgi:hypothetical protein